MKKKILIRLVVCVCLTTQFAFGQHDSKSDELKQKAVQLLNDLKEATSVAPTENLIGLSIDSVKKSGEDYDIYFKCSNSRLENATIGLVTGTHFIDPENYNNHEEVYTIDDAGFMKFSIETAIDSNHPIFSVKLKPASEVMYVYFAGVKEPAPAELRTVPLFFTIVLGDEPFVLEQTPRHAKNLFDEALKK